MNNVILYGNYEYIETQSFAIMNKREARTALERQLGQMVAAEDASPKEIEDMQRALDDLHDGEIEMGEYHFSLAIFGDVAGGRGEEHVCRPRQAAGRARIQDGDRGCHPGMRLVCAAPRQLVDAATRGEHHKPQLRMLKSLANFTRGKRTGNPWGEALAL